MHTGVRPNICSRPQASGTGSDVTFAQSPLLCQEGGGQVRFQLIVIRNQRAGFLPEKELRD
jgi:hypothetical protein